MESEQVQQETGAETPEIVARILILFGTRSEAIKLAPVINELKKIPHFETVVVSSGQHYDLLLPVLEIFEITVDYDLEVMTDDQTPNQVLARTVNSLDVILASESPDLILVQGATSTALAGAVAGFNCDIAVGHIEAGLRTGDLRSPFPEEMNRRLIAQVATFHFAPTDENRRNLLREQISGNRVFVTGNTVIDALNFVRDKFRPTSEVEDLILTTAGMKRILLTTHRRESFRKAMHENLAAIRGFVEKYREVCVIFPVHMNSNARRIASEVLGDCERVFLTEPLIYSDFIHMMNHSWLVVTDSGGVQEEAPSLGKPVLILQEKTDRLEAVMSGVAKIAGGNARMLAEMLENNYLADSWIRSVKEIQNPFGDGGTARRIASILTSISGA